MMAHAQKPVFVFRAKRTSPFKSAGGWRQFSRLLAAEVCAISGSNAGYTVFRGSVKGTGYPLHSPVSPSLPPPVRHRVPSHFNWSLSPILKALDHYVLHEKIEFDQSVALTNSSQFALTKASSPQHRARHAHPPAWIILWSVDCTQHQVPEDHDFNIFVPSPWPHFQPFKRRVKSHLPSAGIIRSSPYTPR